MKGELRITGGAARGAKLFSVEGTGVRPALARMRISVFEILRARLANARVVDLFAGTGALGLEALSRGAAHCTFFDTDPRCVDVLMRNVDKLRLADRARVAQASAFDAWNRLTAAVDIVFVDPPYRQEDVEEFPVQIFKSGLVAPGGILIMEHSIRVTIEPNSQFKHVLERTFGSTVVSFLTPTNP